MSSRWWQIIAIGWLLAWQSSWLAVAQTPSVPVGIRNDMKIPVLIYGLSQGGGGCIRLVTGETVWERLSPRAQRFILIRDAQKGRVILQTVLLIPDQGPVLYSIQSGPNPSTAVLVRSH